jgi:hypothetical protein
MAYRANTRGAFSPDGGCLLTMGSIDTRAWTWRRSEDLVDGACTRLTRNFTKKEWAQYMGDEPYHKTCQDLG